MLRKILSACAVAMICGSAIADPLSGGSNTSPELERINELQLLLRQVSADGVIASIRKIQDPESIDADEVLSRYEIRYDDSRCICADLVYVISTADNHGLPVMNFKFQTTRFQACPI